MSWLSPRTVRGWFVLIVLGALFLSQLASLALLASQQTFLRSALHEAEAFRRTAGIVSLAREANEATRQTIEETASGPSFVVQFAGAPLVEATHRNAALSAALAANVGSRAKDVRVSWDNDVRTFGWAKFEKKLGAVEDKLGFTINPQGWFRKIIGILFLVVGLAVATGAEAGAELADAGAAARSRRSACRFLGVSQ